MNKLAISVILIITTSLGYAQDGEGTCAEESADGVLVTQVKSCLVKTSKETEETNLRDYCDCLADKVKKNIVPKLTAEDLYSYQSAINLQIKKSVDVEIKATIRGVADKVAAMAFGRNILPEKFHSEYRCSYRKVLRKACDKPTIKLLDDRMEGNSRFRDIILNAPRVKIKKGKKALMKVMEMESPKKALHAFHKRSLNIIAQVSRGKELLEDDLHFLKNYIMEYHPIFSKFNYVANGNYIKSPFHRPGHDQENINDFFKSSYGEDLKKNLFDWTTRRDINNFIDDEDFVKASKADCLEVKEQIYNLCQTITDPQSQFSKIDFRFLREQAGPDGLNWLTEEESGNPIAYESARDYVEGRLMCVLNNCNVDSLLKDKDARSTRSQIVQNDPFFSFNTISASMCEFSGGIPKYVSSNVGDNTQNISQFQKTTRKQRFKYFLNSLSEMAVSDSDATTDQIDVDSIFSDESETLDQSIQKARDEGTMGFGKAFSDGANQLVNALGTESKEASTQALRQDTLITPFVTSGEKDVNEGTTNELASKTLEGTTPDKSTEMLKYEELLKKMDEQIAANEKDQEIPVDKKKNKNEELQAKANELKQRINKIKEERKKSASAVPAAASPVAQQTNNSRPTSALAPVDQNTSTTQQVQSSQTTSQKQSTNVQNGIALPERSSENSSNFSAYLDSIGAGDAVYVTKDQLNVKDKGKMNDIFRESKGAPIYTTEISVTGEEVVVIYEPVIDKFGNFIEYRIKEKKEKDAPKAITQKSKKKKETPSTKQKRMTVEDLNKLIDQSK